MSKRQGNERNEYIERKIRKLERKLAKQKERLQTENEELPMASVSSYTLSASDSPIEEEKTDNQPECIIADPESVVTEESLPEEYLLALGEEGKVDDQKGQNIRQEIAERWSNIIKTGIKKENLTALLKKYPTPENFPMATAPKLNTEIAAAVSENIIKRDKKIEYKQNLTGKVLSCLGGLITEIMKGNINSIKLIEGINDSAKILCNMNHYDSLTRRHFILTSVKSCVRQTITDVPTDTSLFGENFSERLKTAKALERSSATIKQPQTYNPNNNNIKPTSSSHPTKKTLNWKGPPQRPSPRDYPRGGPRVQQKQQPQRRPFKQQKQIRRR